MHSRQIGRHEIVRIGHQLCLVLAQWGACLHEATQYPDMIGMADAGRTDQYVMLELQREIAVVLLVDELDAIATLFFRHTLPLAKRSGDQPHGV